MLELYKAYIDDLGNVGSRYATANGFYLSVVTALIAVLALGNGDEPLGVLGIGFVPLLCAAGVIVCWIWYRTIVFYGKLFGAKFATLKAMERSLEFPVYRYEARRLRKQNAGYLTARERRVPLALGLMFAVIGALAIFTHLGS